MAMNIKNPEAQRLAQEVAALTGETLTAAILISLREKLERMQRTNKPGLASELVAIGEDCARHMKQPYLSVDHGDLLYDELGLPK